MEGFIGGLIVFIVFIVLVSIVTLFCTKTKLGRKFFYWIGLKFMDVDLNEEVIDEE